MTGGTDALSVLRPYHPARDGGWMFQDAAHLLRRTQFGASAEDMERSARDGLDATLDRLLTQQNESAEFRTTAALLRRTASDTRDIVDLKAWWLYRMLHSANPLVEKTALFWHNHFATSYAKVQSVEHMADQNDLIRVHALGSFRDLLHGMSRDVAMLIWLDGNANRKRHPNENFAREVMELFSLGVGNYSETDIQEAARAFTGWHVREGRFWFNRLQHDDGEKTVLGRSGTFDGEDVIEICLEQPACARYLADKLLKFFVLPDPSSPVIEELAGRIRRHDFAIAPVLRELFASELFYSDASRQALIKSPLDFVLGAFRCLQCRANLREAARLLADLGQDVFAPPTVKGWEGGRLWVNSTTYLQRANFAVDIVQSNRYGTISPLVETAENRGWTSSQATVEGILRMLLVSKLAPENVVSLTTWFEGSEGSREQRLRALAHLVMTLPEYQLI